MSKLWLKVSWSVCLQGSVRQSAFNTNRTTLPCRQNMTCDERDRTDGTSGFSICCYQWCDCGGWRNKAATGFNSLTMRAVLAASIVRNDVLLFHTRQTVAAATLCFRTLAFFGLISALGPLGTVFLPIYRCLTVYLRSLLVDSVRIICLPHSSVHIRDILVSRRHTFYTVFQKKNIHSYYWL